MVDLNYPGDLYYARSDEWIRIDGVLVTVGISDFAQDSLNDIVYVELPEVDASIEAGEAFGSVESVKAASDLYTPVSGTIAEVNSALEDEPELINADPYGRGWLIRLRVDGNVDTSDLMDAPAYAEYCANR